LEEAEAEPHRAQYRRRSGRQRKRHFYVNLRHSRRRVIWTYLVQRLGVNVGLKNMAQDTIIGMSTTALGAFNNQLMAFLEELVETYPEEKDLQTALEGAKFLRKNNPKLLHSGFMDYIYPDFHKPVLAEDETLLIKKAKEVLSSEFKDYAFAYVIFDRHWATMSENNKKALWNWCKILVVLGQRAAGA